MSKIPRCPYCKVKSRLVTGKNVYPRRKDLWKLKFWVCDDCDARVGCHKDSNRPLGGLANQELRMAKRAAHEAFDPIWRDGELDHDEAYRWLSVKLKICQEECYIGMFDVETCKKVVKLSEDWRNGETSSG